MLLQKIYKTFLHLFSINCCTKCSPPTHKSWSIYKFPFEEKFLSMEKFSSQGKNLICQTWRKVANYLDCDEIKVFDKEQKPKAQKKDILNDLHKCSFCSF